MYMYMYMYICTCTCTCTSTYTPPPPNPNPINSKNHLLSKLNVLLPIWADKCFIQYR